MVAPAITHRETLTSDLLRGLVRAKAEQLVIFRKTATLLGVATVADGIWTEKPYTLTITGETAGELVCSCRAGQAGRTCKHLSAGILARKYSVFAKRPAAQAPVKSERNPLLDLFD